MNTITVGKEKNVLDENSRTFDERERELAELQKQEDERRKREKQSPYSNWYQFNRDHSKAMIKLATKYPKAQAILLFLLEQMDSYNAVMCSYQVFQDALEISQVTVARSIKVLQEKGFIVILKSGTSNVYIVNDDIAWSSWATNRKYCKFPANVILSESENQKYLLEKTKINQVSIKETSETELENNEL